MTKATRANHSKRARPTAPWALSLLLLPLLFVPACSPEPEEPPEQPGPAKPGDPFACDLLDQEVCDCPVGSGVRYCLPDGSGFDECRCAVQEATVLPGVQQLDARLQGEARALSETTVSLPSGNAWALELAPGDPIVLWKPALIGRVLEVRAEGDRILVETEPCELAEIFSKLRIRHRGRISLMSHFPQEAKELLRPKVRERMEKYRESLQTRQQNLDFEGSEGQVGATTGLGYGVSLSMSGEVTGGFDLGDESYLDLSPEFYADLAFPSFDHFAVYAELDLDVLLRFMLSLGITVDATGEIDLIQAFLAAATGVPGIPPLEVPIVPAIFSVQIRFFVGTTANVTAYVSLDTRIETKVAVGGGLAYSDDWGDSRWDDAPERFKAELVNARDGEWETVGFAEKTRASAELLDLAWSVDGAVEIYAKPQLTFFGLDTVGVGINVQPYARLEAETGAANNVAADLGVRGSIFGEVRVPIVHTTAWSTTATLFDESWEVWSHSWKKCGDGWRSMMCDGSTTTSSNCEVVEHCDPGIHWDVTEEGGCVRPGEPDECTCGVGWLPVAVPAGYDEEELGVYTTDDQGNLHWGRLNDCVRSCGNGVHEPDEGEECDEGDLPELLCGCTLDCKLVTPQPSCGNGLVEGTCGETCDDGNDDDCDGCSNACTVPRCGDGRVCAGLGEACDDGNNLWADGCRADCTGREECGDGVVDDYHPYWEGCDDGNTVDGDGCRADCRGTETCGDAILDPGEECDDGNLVDCDGCHADCTLRVAMPDGHVCGNEECDDGNLEDCDACHNDQTLNTGCGDGHRCGAEQCDDGNRVDCDGCHGDCTFPTGCGDGHVCGAELCDDGNFDPCDACFEDCTPNPGNRCGDGWVCGNEVCDDDNTASGDGCRADCLGLERCGDGLVDPAKGEVCDDGNRTSGDGCRADCRGSERCGDELLDTGEICEISPQWGDVDPGCQEGTPTCAGCQGCEARCGDGIAAGNEVCDYGPAEIDDGCPAHLPLCDGTCSRCWPDCSENVCGDGVVCPGEQCDDGNLDDCDGCHHDCTFQTGCGDGFLCDAEVCDDGNKVGGDGCRANCMGTEECGDGQVDYATGESCEDTSADGVDLGCTATHPNCGTTIPCVGCTAHECGDGVLGPGEVCDGEVRDCVVTGPGYQGTQACAATCNGYAGCLPIESCGDGILNGNEVCDDGNVADCDGCRGDCQNLETGCGDGWVCGGEVCDDGNVEPCVGGCDATCSAEVDKVCGDGVIHPCEVCENTDPTNAGIDLGCEATSPNCNVGCGSCTPDVCGDGIMGPTEVCDLGGTCNPGGAECTTLNVATVCPAGSICRPNDGIGCRADCKSTYVCGNGMLDKDEMCDDGNTVGGDGCSADCRSTEVCGNGWTDYEMGEVCDGRGEIGQCDWGCALDCSHGVVCGDGIVDCAEQCDDGGLCTFDWSTPCARTVTGDAEACYAISGGTNMTCWTLDGDGCSATCTVE